MAPPSNEPTSFFERARQAFPQHARTPYSPAQSAVINVAQLLDDSAPSTFSALKQEADQALTHLNTRFLTLPIKRSGRAPETVPVMTKFVAVAYQLRDGGAEPGELARMMGNLPAMYFIGDFEALLAAVQRNDKDGALLMIAMLTKVIRAFINLGPERNHQPSPERKHFASLGGKAKAAKLEPVKKHALELAQKRRFPSRRQAVFAIRREVLEYARALGVPLSDDQSERTLSGWLKDLFPASRHPTSAKLQGNDRK